MSALHSALVLVTALEQDCQHFDGRIESQSVGSSPTLDSSNTNAGLQHGQWNVPRRKTMSMTYAVLSAHVKLP